jgi:hypothetical protein
MLKGAGWVAACAPCYCACCARARARRRRRRRIRASCPQAVCTHVEAAPLSRPGRRQVLLLRRGDLQSTRLSVAWARVGSLSRAVAFFAPPQRIPDVTPDAWICRLCRAKARAAALGSARAERRHLAASTVRPSPRCRAGQQARSATNGRDCAHRLHRPASQAGGRAFWTDEGSLEDDPDSIRSATRARLRCRIRPPSEAPHAPGARRPAPGGPHRRPA